ncbi:hypothetical protein K2Q02_01300 [Patescibacteria group bacterium]|nr:hypothetical protein [Patescibacteria group bacterium]
METQTHTTFPTSHQRTYTRILQDITQEEELIKTLRPKPGTINELGITVAVILYVPFDKSVDGQVLQSPEMLRITEWQDFGGGYRVKKVPAGSMNSEDKDIYGAANRELFSETGYVAEGGWEVTRVVETTSTIESVRHFKAFLTAKDAVKRGEPSEACIESVDRISIKDMQSKDSQSGLAHMTYDQGIGFRPFIEKVKNFSMHFALGTMNLVVKDWYPKG